LSHDPVDLSRIVVQHAYMGTSRFRDSIRVRLPANLYERLDEAARRDGRTHSEIVREALRMALGPQRSEQQPAGQQ
jgi:metal-responsive CopG/Arc/MetJ family transcriptional regulator